LIHCGEPQVGPQEAANVNAVLASGLLTRGDWCRRFARRLADKLGDVSVEPVSSGTTALHLALMALGVGPGDEVIVPATTYVATGNAVLYCGAKPVIVDVDRWTWTIDELAFELALTPKTRAVIPVHLYGVPAPRLNEMLADHYRRTGRFVYVVEDCAEALGAARHGVPVGTIGVDASAWSFYASKTITTGGEGGAVASRNWLTMSRARLLATQAMSADRYYHDAVGWNYRMTEMQAAFGVAQLDRLGEFIEKRRQVFEWYDARLADRFMRQSCPQGYTHGRWAYAIRIDGTYRQSVQHSLEAAGVETRPVFPPLWSHPQFGEPSYDWETNADAIHDDGLVLPTHCGLTEEDVDTVCKELIRAVEKA
jgi:perosamine synthetase